MLELFHYYWWHYLAQIGISFRNPNQIEFVFFSFAQPPVRITPGPNFSLNDFLQRCYWNSLAQQIHRFGVGQELLITLIESELNSQLTSFHLSVH